MSMTKLEKVYKIVLAGDGGVGKTALRAPMSAAPLVKTRA